MTDERSTHPHLEGLIPPFRATPMTDHNDESVRLWNYESGWNACREEVERRIQVLAALPGGGVDGLSRQLQQRCSGWGAYWRAPDAHGVILSQEQALELLRDAIGVEVEIQAPAQECPHRFRCDCLGACKHGFSGSGAETPTLPTPNPHKADRNG